MICTLNGHDRQEQRDASVIAFWSVVSVMSRFYVFWFVFIAFSKMFQRFSGAFGNTSDHSSSVEILGDSIMMLTIYLHLFVIQLKKTILIYYTDICGSLRLPSLLTFLSTR